MRIILFILLLAASAAAQPNIVLIFADDLDVATLSTYGGESWSTPNIDSIANDGMTFTDMRSQRACATSRATLMTGRYASVRHDPIITGGSPPVAGMNTAEVTIADILVDAGYTAGVFGKWGLILVDNTDLDSAINHAAECGFNEAWCFGSAGYAITDPYGNPTNIAQYWPWMENDKALTFMEEQVANNNPFFLYYPTSFPKSPFGPTPLNPGDTDTEENNVFNYVIQYHDLMVGNILNKITDLGIENNTVVMYIGDNGTLSSVYNQCSGNLVKGSKFSRPNNLSDWVPGFFKWPGTIDPGTTYDGVTCLTDVFYTIATIAEAQVPEDVTLDGRPFYENLLGRTNHHRTYMFDNVAVVSKDYRYDVDYGLFISTHKPWLHTVVADTNLFKNAVAEEVHLQWYTNMIVNPPTNNYIFGE